MKLKLEKSEPVNFMCDKCQDEALEMHVAYDHSQEKIKQKMVYVILNAPFGQAEHTHVDSVFLEKWLARTHVEELMKISNHLHYWMEEVPLKDYRRD